MKKQYLDAEEKEIMEAIENDEFVPVTGIELKRVADAIAARKRSQKSSGSRSGRCSCWSRTKQHTTAMATASVYT